MKDNKHPSTQATLTYHYFSIKKNLTIRYGVAHSYQKPLKGIIFLLHGRSEFIEKYKGIAKKLQRKGFIVVSPDWRGQGLSSRELENRHKGHINRFDDYVDDLELLYAKLIKSKGLPVYILAHSMGAHIALRFMERHPLKIQKAVLVSPMIDITLPAIMKSVSKQITKKLSQSRFAGKYVFGSTDYSVQHAKFKGNNLCHDQKSYWILHNEIAKNPELAIGGITWGWLHAAFESIDILKQDAVIEKITPPILMVSAQKDLIVSTKAQETLSQKLPDCRFLSIKGGFHELLFEEAKIKAKLWDAVNLFLND